MRRGRIPRWMALPTLALGGFACDGSADRPAAPMATAPPGGAADGDACDPEALERLADAEATLKGWTTDSDPGGDAA